MVLLFIVYVPQPSLYIEMKQGNKQYLWQKVLFQLKNILFLANLFLKDFSVTPCITSVIFGRQTTPRNNNILYTYK